MAISSKYAEREDCFNIVDVGQKIRIGWFYSQYHIPEWTNGFSDMNNNMIYVPENSLLIGPDNLEYKLILEEVGLKNEEHWAMYHAFLDATEQRFGLGTKVRVNLQDANHLRFNEKAYKKSIFKVKQIGLVPTIEFERPKDSFIKRLLKKVA